MAPARSKKREIVKTYVNGGTGQVSMVIPADIDEVIIDTENRRVTVLMPTTEARRVSRNLLASANQADSIQRSKQ